MAEVMPGLHKCEAPGCWKLYPTAREADLCTPLDQIAERYGSDALAR